MPIGSVAPVVAGNYRDMFVVIGTCAATLIGLLFVAISITQEGTRARPQAIREFRAAAALLAFTNAFTVSLFGLVPGTNMGYPAAVVGAVGILFTAGGCVRSSRSTFPDDSVDLRSRSWSFCSSSSDCNSTAESNSWSIDAVLAPWHPWPTS